MSTTKATSPSWFDQARDAINNVDFDKNGVPTWRDGAELKRGARAGLQIFRFVSWLFPKQTAGARPVADKVEEGLDLVDGRQP